MSHLPIYNILKERFKDVNVDLTPEQKKICCENVMKLDQQGIENVFLILRIHSIKEGDENILNVPYNGEERNKKESCTDLKFNLETFPIILKHMIYQFTIIHLTKMKEEFERNEI
jgi:hypothetical protein